MARTITPSSVIVDGVPSSDLGYVYEDCWPYLAKALARSPQTPETFTKETLLDFLLIRRGQLWIAWDTDEGVIGAVTTLLTTKYGPFLEVPLIGGIRFAEWGKSLLTTLDRFGLEKGCTHMIGFGRKGWMRVYGFKEFGRTDDGVLIMVRELKE